MTGAKQRMVIVADDLTGAVDTAAPFAVHGHSVVVVVDMQALPKAMAMDVDIVTVTTRSREIDAEEAARRVAVVQASAPQGMRLLKKVDSRLKGNVEAEIAALKFERAVVLPAIPEFGRIVRNGMIEGFGVDKPISIAERLGAIAPRSVIPDTLTQQDMFEAVEVASPDDLLVGALSLAKALVKQTGVSVSESVTFSSKRLIIAIGSRDPITVAQVVRLKDALPALVHISVRGGVASTEEAAAANRAAADVILIQAIDGDVPTTESAVSDALAQTVSVIAGRGDTLLLSGGASAEAFLQHQGVQLMSLIGEVLPGLPVAEHEGQFYITKSGGFGDPDTLLQVVNVVTKRKVLA